MVTNVTYNQIKSVLEEWIRLYEECDLRAIDGGELVAAKMETENLLNRLRLEAQRKGVDNVST